ncbi:MAG: polyphenol oxidase family protein [Acidimicrobiales bacterium]
MPAAVVPEAPRPWTWLRQVHRTRVVVVSQPGEHAGAEADAAVTGTPGCVLVIRTADCVPIVLVGDRAVGVVHAGWKGLVAGVIRQAVAAIRDLDEGPIAAHLGPCIRPGCYEFDGPELNVLTAQLGVQAATTTWGTRAFDLPGAAASELRAAAVERIFDEAGCTACDERSYSHRARGEVERIATLAWLVAP